MTKDYFRFGGHHREVEDPTFSAIVSPPPEE
jgi:hypothetical protein